MKKALGIALAVALGIGLYALAVEVPSALSHDPYGGWGPGWRGGYGMMGPGMMGPGMMGPGMMGPGGGGYGFLGTLTPEQQTKFEIIRAKAREKLAPLSARLNTLQIEVRNLLSAATLDEAAIRAKAAEIAKVREEVTKARAETRIEEAKVLTPEQRQQLGGAGFGRFGYGRGPAGRGFGGPMWGY